MFTALTLLLVSQLPPGPVDGFRANVDIHRVEVPERVDPVTWEICCRVKKVYRIEVRYPPSDIRRGH